MVLRAVGHAAYVLLPPPTPTAKDSERPCLWSRYSQICVSHMTYAVSDATLIFKNPAPQHEILLLRASYRLSHHIKAIWYYEHT